MCAFSTSTRNSQKNSVTMTERNASVEQACRAYRPVEGSSLCREHHEREENARSLDFPRRSNQWRDSVEWVSQSDFSLVLLSWCCSASMNRGRTALLNRSDRRGGCTFLRRPAQQRRGQRVSAIEVVPEPKDSVLDRCATERWFVSVRSN